MLRNYGSKLKYHHDLPGSNSRLDSLQAAALRKSCGAWTSGTSGGARLRSATWSGSQASSGSAARGAGMGEPVWHLFVVRHPRRDALQRRLSEAGVDTMIHYPIPPHLSGAYAADFEGAELPVAERLAEEVLSLPIGPHLALEDADAGCGGRSDAFGAPEVSTAP